MSIPTPENLGVASAEIEANRAGRDFVVGDVHGEFPALSHALRSLRFEPGKDRLFGLGDLVDRGPASADAIEWIKQGRFRTCVRGNHEQFLLEAITDLDYASMPDWFVNIAANDAARRQWRSSLLSLPIALTVHTAHGPIGLVHAAPTHVRWETMIAKLSSDNTDEARQTVWTAMSSTTRTRGNTSGKGAFAAPARGWIRGVRAVLVGHVIVTHPRISDNVWSIDTGAGDPAGALTIVRIDSRRLRATRWPTDERTRHGWKARVRTLRARLRIRGR